jgi:SAM-dependent MidA family methyltransferase
VDAAKSWLLSIEGNAAEGESAKQLRQFQTLTHPSLMGQQFKVAELGKSL